MSLVSARPCCFRYGNYSCVAENKLGRAEGIVELFETVIPICPPACDSYNYSSGAAAVGAWALTILLILLVGRPGHVTGVAAH